MVDTPDAVEKVEVGDYLYVWKKGSGHASTAVITAHGNGTLINSRKPMKVRTGDGSTPRLQFFVAHGQSVSDTGLTSFLNRNVVEELTPVTCPEYVLGKYTNSDWDSKLPSWRIHNNSRENYHTVKYSREHPDTDYDIITIRSRFDLKGMMGIPFSQILSDLQAAGYNYDLIKCAFCRGGDPDPITAANQQGGQAQQDAQSIHSGGSQP